MHLTLRSVCSVHPSLVLGTALSNVLKSDGIIWQRCDTEMCFSLLRLVRQWSTLVVRLVELFKMLMG